MSQEIHIPYNFELRDYQRPLWDAMVKEDQSRAVAVWHRRSGKDKTAMNLIAREMFSRKGMYLYLFPTYTQGRKILWHGMDSNGFKFIDHIPPEIRLRTNSQQMLIEAINGSIFQVVGTDRNVDSLVGTNPVGCVFSEYSIQDPKAWRLIRPILAENEGWALFIYTPRGKNHGYNLLQLAQDDPDYWFSQVLDVDDTEAINKKALAREKKEMRMETGNDGLFMQEFYCDFAVPVQGSYYGEELMALEDNGQITGVPYVSDISVDTAWDLGVDDQTAIWFFQVVGREIHFIDYLEDSGEGLKYYAKQLQEKPYVYGTHYMPHDINVRELGSGKSRLETAQNLGIKPITVAPKQDVADGIQAVRSYLGQCWFDEDRCEDGLSALRSYRRKWDDKKETFKNRPEHDWASHAADAFRYFAVSFEMDRAGDMPPATAKKVVLDPY